MKKHTLLFDAKSDNGIICILCDNILIDSVSLVDKDKKNDSVLTYLAVLLESNNVDRKKIEKILFTDSNQKEGKSLTRNRILGSILLGLKNSLNLEVLEISENERHNILRTKRV